MEGVVKDNTVYQLYLLSSPDNVKKDDMISLTLYLRPTQYHGNLDVDMSHSVDLKRSFASRSLEATRVDGIDVYN
jgi:hypothetical protein